MSICLEAADEQSVEGDWDFLFLIPVTEFRLPFCPLLLIHGRLGQLLFLWLLFGLYKYILIECILLAIVHICLTEHYLYVFNILSLFLVLVAIVPKWCHSFEVFIINILIFQFILFMKQLLLSFGDWISRIYHTLRLSYLHFFLDCTFLYLVLPFSDI